MLEIFLFVGKKEGKTKMASLKRIKQKKKEEIEKSTVVEEERITNK